MESVTQVQILDEAIVFHVVLMLSCKTWIHLFYLPAMGK